MNLAERLHRAWGGARRQRVLRDHLCRLLPQGASLLDVGCGDGRLSAGIRERRPDLTLQGVDVLVRPDVPIPVEPYDGRRLPYGDGSFDCVLFADVLHHCEEPEGVLAEAVRVARRCVLVKDHVLHGPLSGRLLRFMDDVGNRRFGVALPYHYWPEARWRREFAALGLEIAAWIPRLRLYPVPLDWIFGRGLHFIARLDVPGPGAAARAGR